ncbi:MAG: hypothetical protein M3N26_06480 [Pseudomonadota bacterium]|nr:hypothetical protein [Pseudomonadota bacterium]
MDEHLDSSRAAGFHIGSTQPLLSSTRLKRAILMTLLSAAPVLAQTMAQAQDSPVSTSQSMQASNHGKESAGSANADMGGGHGVGSYPKYSFDTLVNAEVAGLAADHPPGRGPGGSLRVDARGIYNVSDSWLVDGLFQFKPRAPRPAGDPNNGLFTNQGAGREEGGKMKELYVRWGDYRVGKFVQNFGRAYLMLPGPYAADFIEESDDGYEPSEMVGGEYLHVFDKEDTGWRQLSLSAFMVDRTVLHRSYPYDEGRIHLHDGGLGNTRLPQNVMATYDVLNQPVGNWGQLTYQASVIRWGKPVDAERGEFWTTLGADLAVPVQSSLASTLQNRYSQLRFYVEGTRREHFKGVAGQTRDYLSASTEYLNGPWVFDVTTTQRWTRNTDVPMQKGALYTTTVGYKFPGQLQVSMSLANESVDGRRGTYAGVRLTKTLTTCNRCQVNGSAY